MSDSPTTPCPAHWRKSFVRPRSKDRKSNFDLLFDAMNPVKIPKMNKSTSSDETMELPRSFPPPGYAWYPPPPPPPPPPQQVRDLNTIPQPRSPSTSVQSSSDSCPSYHVHLPNSPPVVPRFTVTKQRVDLDGHAYSSDGKDRRGIDRLRAADYDTLNPIPYCAQCGRPRSRRYRLENPVERDIVPVPGICSRCVPPVSENVPAEKGMPPRRNEREVEEILIRRGRRNPDPVIRVFQPRSADIIHRVVKRSRSSSPRPIQSKVRRYRRSSSSDGTNNNQIQGKPNQRMNRYERSVPNERISYPSHDFKVRVQSRSGTLNDDASPQTAAKCKNRCADQLIASHPNAWSHVRLIYTDNLSHKQPAARDSNAEDQSYSAPTEWFYRNRKTYIEPDTRERKSRNEYWDRNGRIDESGYRRGVAAARGISQTWRRASSSDGGSLVRGILQRPVRDDIYRDRYETDRDIPERFNRPRHNDAIDDAEGPRVKFVDPSREEKSRNISRRKEAVRDWVEEKVDQKDFKNIKKQVRHDVQEGAGAFELDGHHSEEHGKQDSHEDLHTQYRHIPAPMYSPMPGSSQMHLTAVDAVRTSALEILGAIQSISEISQPSHRESVETGTSVDALDARDRSRPSPLSPQALSSLLSGYEPVASIGSDRAPVPFTGSSRRSPQSEDVSQQDIQYSRSRAESVSSHQHRVFGGSETNSRVPSERDNSEESEMTELVDDLARSHISDDRASGRTDELNRVYATVLDSRGDRSSGSWEAEENVAQIPRLDSAKNHSTTDYGWKEDNSDRQDADW